LQQPDAKQAGILERLQRIDRRYIFLLMAVAVLVPTVWHVRMPMGAATRPVKLVFDRIESLEEGSVVLIAYDYGPSTIPELSPMGTALIRHCFMRNINVLGMTLVPQGAPLCESGLNEAAQEFGKKPGEDYVNLGYMPGVLPVLMGMDTDIPGTFGTDYSGNRMSDLPLMRWVRSYDDIALAVDLASSTTPDAWISVVNARYGQEVAAGVTAVMAVDYYPYVHSRQLVGLLGGLKGAAEYEGLLGHRDKATQRMPAQSFGHGLIIAFVLLGNTAYVMGRIRARRGR
jgi:hypothetical protein